MENLFLLILFALDEAANLEAADHRSASKLHAPFFAACRLSKMHSVG
jgi:hypothetical protein